MTKRDLLKRLREIAAFVDEYYELKRQLIQKMKPGERVMIGDQEFELVDQFADKNQAWKPVLVERFYLKPSKEE